MALTRTLRTCRFVWLLAAMALFGQIVGAVVMPEMAQAAGSGTLGAICGVDVPTPGHAPLHHQHHDCAVCPLCAAAAVHAVLLSPAPVLALPVVTASATPGLRPPARAPPSWQFDQPFPRGPPASA